MATTTTTIVRQIVITIREIQIILHLAFHRQIQDPQLLLQVHVRQQQQQQQQQGQLLCRHLQLNQHRLTHD